MPALPPLAVVDVDGVLADVRHRLHHLDARPPSWPRFFAAADRDGLLEEGERTVRALAEASEVLYLSGRPEHLREVTVRWLARHDLPPGELRLRPEGDHRPGADLKVRALRDLSRTHTVVVLVDDDPRVLDAARAAGYDVLPATWMGRHRSLQRAQEDDGVT